MLYLYHVLVIPELCGEGVKLVIEINVQDFIGPV